jgi:hypothetical protein
VLRTLDALRARPTKFVCINDDTSELQTPTQAEQVDKALSSLFQAWFPHPSKYENQANQGDFAYFPVPEEDSASWYLLFAGVVFMFGFGGVLVWNFQRSRSRVHNKRM